MDSVHEDTFGIRQAVEIGMHQGARGSEKEHTAPAVHDELGRVHEHLRLASARRSTEKAPAFSHISIEIPDAVDIQLLADELEEGDLIRRPRRSISEGSATNNSIPAVLQANDLGARSIHDLAAQKERAEQPKPRRTGRLQVKKLLIKKFSL